MFRIIFPEGEQIPVVKFTASSKGNALFGRVSLLAIISATLFFVWVITIALTSISLNEVATCYRSHEDGRLVLIIVGVHIVLLIAQVIAWLFYIRKRRRLFLPLTAIIVAALLGCYAYSSFSSAFQQSFEEFSEQKPSTPSPNETIDWNEHNAVIQLVEQGEIRAVDGIGGAMVSLPAQYRHLSECGEITVDKRDGILRVFFFTSIRYQGASGYMYKSDAIPPATYDFSLPPSLPYADWYECVPKGERWYFCVYYWH